MMGQVVVLMNKEGNSIHQLLANVDRGEIRTLLEFYPLEKTFLAFS